jgi:cyanophycinase
MTPGSRWISLLAVGTLATTGSLAPPGADRPRGALVIVGGGDRSEAMMRRFVELAGGAGARIAVVPNASSEPEETGRALVAELDSLGARAFVYLLDRRAAESSAAARRLDSVGGIWFSGGDQAFVIAALAGTAAHRAMQRRYREGAVVGGTSAGAAIMSDSMITGNQTPPGDTTIVDQHFIRRERHNRLMSAVLERPRLLGVGIDESTALEVGPDGRWRVLGESSVVIYDARRARVTDGKQPLLGATGLRVHVLPAGAVFDPGTGGGDL